MIKPEVFQAFFEANLPENKEDGKRMDWDDYFLLLAASLALRSTCKRRKYGSVIAKDWRLISSGYNGAPKGDSHCIDGECWRDKNNIPHGQQYEKCIAVHSEVNAITYASQRAIEGANIYIVGYDCKEHKFIAGIPCSLCRPIIRNAGIKNFITKENGISGELIIEAP